MSMNFRQFRKEALEVLKLQIPVSLTILLGCAIRLTAVAASGHLSVDELSAASLANTIANIIGTGTILGICSASDTFFAQSFGADKKMMGFFLQQTFIVVGGAMILVVSIVVGGAMILVVSLMLNMGRILPLIGQSELISEMTSHYLLFLIPGVIFEALARILSSYLQAQNKALPPTIAVLIANIFNITSQVVALKVLHFRYLASAVCESASLFLFSIALLFYILIFGVYKDTWNGWTHKSLYNMKRFMKLAIPGWLLFLIEIGTFQVGVLVMGIISETQMSAQSILQVICVACAVWSLGFSEAVSIRVGQSLGSGLPNDAKFSFAVSTVMCVVLGTCFSIMCVSLRTYLPQIFTQDERVISAAQTGLLYFSIFPFIDFLATVLTGVLNGSGLQLSILIILLIGYVIVAQPIGIPLALFTNMKLGGIWVGYCVGLAFEISIYSVIIYRLDWQKQADLAKERCSQEADESSSEDIQLQANSKTHLLSVDNHKDTTCNRKRRRAFCVLCLTYGCLSLVFVASVVSYVLQETVNISRLSINLTSTLSPPLLIHG